MRDSVLFRVKKEKNRIMKELIFLVEPDEAGTRIDKCIALRLGDEYSRTYVKYLIEHGLVRVNDETVKPRYSAREADNVVVEMVPLEKEEDVEPEDILLDILYEDNWVIVVNKKAGMVVHPGAGNKTGTLVSALLHHCGCLPDAGDDQRPGIVHRLDKDTSGVIIVAKNDRALRSLSKQFQNRTTKKEYIALVKGHVELDNGVVDEPLARHTGDRKKIIVDHERGKASRTIYHVVRRFKKFTFLRLEPETGRTHQIRVHMKYLGHPIVGDVTYGGGRWMSRQALHAESLGITHPGEGKFMEFSAPMPDDIREFLDNAEE